MDIATLAERLTHINEHVQEFYRTNRVALQTDDAVDDTEWEMAQTLKKELEAAFAHAEVPLLIGFDERWHRYTIRSIG